MLSFKLLIFSIIQFLIMHSLEAALTHPFPITKRCTNQAKLVPKSIPTKRLWKWLDDDANRKQYELVNKLWHKTNIYLDVKVPTATEPQRTSFGKKYQTKPSAARHLDTKRSTTPSLFEFYYRDELDPVSVRNKKKNIEDNSNKSNKKRFQDQPKSIFLKYPLEGFRKINESCKKRHSLFPRTSKIENHVTKKKLFDGFDNFFFYQRNPELSFKLQRIQSDGKTSHTSKYIFDHFFERLKRYDSDLKPDPKTITDENKDDNKTISTLVLIPTDIKNISKKRDLSTFYDKVKFFEIYDDGTIDMDDNLDKNDSNENDYIIRNLTNFINNASDYKDMSTKTDNIIVVESINNLNNIHEPMEIDKDYKSDKITKDVKHSNSWEDYPFVAVYIYQPLQVYCDAAALSPHWVLTSGHCLSQTQNNKIYNKKHSAYVTYCGSQWKEPGRISYVKFSVIHPKFDANDEELKYLYNVGVVQVVTPMSSCPGWAPVLMVSHQFIPTNDSSTITTIGWGLDRFVGKPSSSNFTKRRQLFSVNTESVTSGDCIPERLWAERDLHTNVYCLRTKDEGHVRGSLMMYQGRLVALYLQESLPGFDQYTGLWKVVPWLNQVIKETTKEEFPTYD